jgi:putative membrane protein
MIQTEKQGFAELMIISLPFLLLNTAYATLILFVEESYGDHLLEGSAQIGSVFGIAVAFFLGFRMNSAYDRWWEARKIFGELTNNSRSFAAKIFTYFQNPGNLVAREVPHSNQIAAELIDLTCAYVAQLKSEIHEIPHPAYEEETELLLEAYAVNPANKVSNEMLVAISAKIEAVFSRDATIEKSDLMQQINRFYDIQGKAERINNTPFLKIYSAFTRLTVTIYVLLIPLFIGDIDIGGEEHYLELLSIPIIAIIGTLFLTINKLANLYGEPLEENRTSVPIDLICQTIIRNCQEVKGKLIQSGGGMSLRMPDQSVR